MQRIENTERTVGKFLYDMMTFLNKLMMKTLHKHTKNKISNVRVAFTNSL